MSEVIFSHPLNDFVEKYFVRMDFSDSENISEDYLVEILSQVENVVVKVRERLSKFNNTDDPIVWLNREMCLRALVVLTQFDKFSEIIEKKGYIKRASSLLSRIIEEFSQKILEDPEIVQAIQEDRLEEEIEKRMPKNIDLNTRISSFMQMIESKPLEDIPENYEKVPDNF
jgi:predicted RND superfamily exporter protein